MYNRHLNTNKIYLTKLQFVELFLTSLLTNSVLQLLKVCSGSKKKTNLYVTYIGYHNITLRTSLKKLMCWVAEDIRASLYIRTMNSFMMEAVHTSETSVNFNVTTQH
jgi:hypothetical protein